MIGNDVSAPPENRGYDTDWRLENRGGEVTISFSSRRFFWQELNAILFDQLNEKQVGEIKGWHLDQRCLDEFG